MRAIAIDDFGVSPALRDLPVPEPGTGELLVRVQSSSINGFDVAVAGGWLKGMMEHRFPVIPGKDFAGMVAAIGSGVSQFAVGDRVFGVVAKPVPGGWRLRRVHHRSGELRRRTHAGRRWLPSRRRSRPGRRCRVDGG